MEALGTIAFEIDYFIGAVESIQFNMIEDLKRVAGEEEEGAADKLALFKDLMKGEVTRFIRSLIRLYTSLPYLYVKTEVGYEFKEKINTINSINRCDKLLKVREEEEEEGEEEEGEEPIMNKILRMEKDIKYILNGLTYVMNDRRRNMLYELVWSLCGPDYAPMNKKLKSLWFNLLSLCPLNVSEIRQEQPSYVELMSIVDFLHVSIFYSSDNLLQTVNGFRFAVNYYPCQEFGITELVQKLYLHQDTMSQYLNILNVQLGEEEVSRYNQPDLISVSEGDSHTMELEEEDVIMNESSMDKLAILSLATRFF